MENLQPTPGRLAGRPGSPECGPREQGWHIHRRTRLSAIEPTTFTSFSGNYRGFPNGNNSIRVSYRARSARHRRCTADSDTLPALGGAKPPQKGTVAGNAPGGIESATHQRCIADWAYELNPFELTLSGKPRKRHRPPLFTNNMAALASKID